MTVNELVTYILGSPRDPLALELAEWATASPRFKTFAESYRDKIRKKARNMRDEEGRKDLRFELQVAHWLLQERHLTVEYEKYMAGKQRGPDFTVTFRTRTVFNVEAKRQRAAGVEPREEDGAESSRLVRSVCDKLGQMPPSAINVLALGVEGAAYDDEEVSRTMRVLLQRAEHKDEAFFTRRGFAGTREFFKQYAQLSGVLVRPVQVDVGAAPVLWSNPQARHRIPKEIAAILMR